MSDSEKLEAALDEMWRKATADLRQPGRLVEDRGYWRVLGDTERAKNVCSPSGLAGIFPAIRKGKPA